MNTRESKIKESKTNQEITASELLLVGDDGKNYGVVGLDQALYLAYQLDTDLVMINENQNPPIAKLMDYGKHLYNLQKQISKQKARSHETEIKEVRMGIKIGDHDLAVKIGRIKKFFDAGDKVKVTIQLRGREMIFQDRVKALIEKIKLESGGVGESDVERMGNRFSTVLIKSK